MPSKNNEAVHLTEFITFQVWAACLVSGLLVSVVVGDLMPAIIAAWVGLLAGVAANELTEGHRTAGIRWRSR